MHPIQKRHRKDSNGIWLGMGSGQRFRVGTKGSSCGGVWKEEYLSRIEIVDVLQGERVDA